MLLPELPRGMALGDLRREMDRLLDGHLGVHSRWPRPTAFPALNVWGDEGNVYAEAELPGVPMTSLEMYVLGNELTIKGERKPATDEGAVLHRQERGTGAFSRTVTLPVDLDAEKVVAKLESGVLTVTMPKAESVKPKRIEIKVK